MRSGCWKRPRNGDSRPRWAWGVASYSTLHPNVWSRGDRGYSETVEQTYVNLRVRKRALGDKAGRSGCEIAPGGNARGSRVEGHAPFDGELQLGDVVQKGRRVQRERREQEQGERVKAGSQGIELNVTDDGCPHQRREGGRGKNSRSVLRSAVAASHTLQPTDKAMVSNGPRHLVNSAPPQS